MVLLPRNQKQGHSLSRRWPQLFADGRVRIPKHAVDGLNLIWNSDLVISGGGTMNREAAALRVPVYSVFRGKIGAVDQYLARTGRLVLLESVNDVQTKIALVRRPSLAEPNGGNSSALQTILKNVETILGKVSEIRGVAKWQPAR
jgi:predicted glycosyltransferase